MSQSIWHRLCALDFPQLLGLVVTLMDVVTADAADRVRSTLVPARMLLRRASWGEAFGSSRVYAHVLEPACRASIWARTPVERQVCRLAEAAGRSLLARAGSRSDRRQVQWQIMLTLLSLQESRSPCLRESGALPATGRLEEFVKEA